MGRRPDVARRARLRDGRRRLQAGCLAGAALAFAGCGDSSDQPDVAPPQTIAVGQTEPREHRAGFLLEVRTIELTATGWRVDAAITNRTAASWFVGRPHRPGETKFGLFVKRNRADLRPAALEATQETTPQLVAERSEPPVPHILRPRGRWSGWFAGSGRLPAGSYVAVAFGRLVTSEQRRAGLPPALMAISRPIRIPGGG